MKEKFINLYMSWAKRAAEMSYATRLKVGAVIVKDDSVISFGYNGTPAGWDNNCEIKDYMSADAGGWLSPEEIEERWPYEDEKGKYQLKTKPEVLHAEMNSLMKLARKNESGLDASMFITHSPCIECAKGIYQAGIKEVYYLNEYRSTNGIEFLKNCNISVKKLENNIDKSST